MRTLKQGVRGPDVQRFQNFLLQQGLLDKVDGYFGRNTAEATRAFQVNHDLTVDGVVGPQTLNEAIRLGFEQIRRITSEEVTEEITQHAKRIIKEHHREPFGTEISFIADGKRFVARIEEHFHEPGGPVKPWGHHPGVSVFAVVEAEPAVDEVFDPAVDPEGETAEMLANASTPQVGGFRLSGISLSRLVGVHADLISIVKKAIEITDIDFTVLEGMRSIERQRELVARGASRTMNSRHLTGHAVDLAPMVGRKVIWDWPMYDRLAEFVKEAASLVNVPVEWGGDWTSFRDGPHWQLPRNQYPR